jgi:hypothetical protein
VGTAFHSLAPQGEGWVGEGAMMIPNRAAGAPCKSHHRDSHSMCIDAEEEINAPCCLPNSLLLVAFHHEKATSVGT